MNDHEAAAAGSRTELELEQTRLAFAEVRQAILDELIETPPMQVDKIAKLHMAAQNLAAVHKALLDVVANGQTARFAIAAAELTRP